MERLELVRSLMLLLVMLPVLLLNLVGLRTGVFGRRVAFSGDVQIATLKPLGLCRLDFLSAFFLEFVLSSTFKFVSHLCRIF